MAAVCVSKQLLLKALAMTISGSSFLLAHPLHVCKFQRQRHIPQ